MSDRPAPLPAPWACGPADLKLLMPWIYERLTDFYRGVSIQMMHNWLSQTMNSNEYLFIRTKRSVGLFAVVRGELGLVHAEEKFVLTEEKHEPEGQSLYKAAANWAGNAGLKEIRVENMSDLPRDMIIASLGGSKVYRREQAWIRLRSP